MPKTTLSILQETKDKLERARLIVSYKKGRIVDMDITIIHLIEFFDKQAPRPKPKPITQTQTQEPKTV